MTVDQNVSQEKGPFSYENWKAANIGMPSATAFEYPFFTDAHIVGDHIFEGLGPYQLINAVALPEVRQFRPSLVLHAKEHSDSKLPNMTETDDSRYHGGNLADEIASIISLCLGIRLKSGGANRIFGIGGDPKGLPTSSWGYTQDPVLPTLSKPPVIPQALGIHHLKNIVILETFPSLSLENSIALVRATRLYQEAIWIAESTPELSWIMLVSAVETVANRWRTAIEMPIDRLRASRPELEDILRGQGNDKFVASVAEQIAPYMGATKKFIDFVLEFLPPPPKERPTEAGQHSWTKSAIKKTMGKIYSYRSRALHGGHPFPAPMCQAPQGFGGGIEEIPLGLATSMQGAVWLAKDTPMLLHTFEYIVRQTILKWWESQV
ncbi:MAG: hypothetical protein KDJ97_10525 [Anaerolineae bacterium]|nr:hypothetical protein [Anaerolineae bacterium]